MLLCTATTTSFSCTNSIMEEIIADLTYIRGYADLIRDDVQAGREPLEGYLSRMRDLAEKVQRHFDKDLQAMETQG